MNTLIVRRPFGFSIIIQVVIFVSACIMVSYICDFSKFVILVVSIQIVDSLP